MFAKSDEDLLKVSKSKPYYSQKIRFVKKAKKSKKESKKKSTNLKRKRKIQKFQDKPSHPYSGLVSNNHSKNNDYQKMLGSKASSKTKNSIKNNYSGSLQGTAYAEFYSSDVVRDLKNDSKIRILAKGVEDHLEYDLEYPKNFPMGYAKLRLRKRSGKWCVASLQGDPLARSVVYDTYQSLLNDSYLKETLEKITHKNIDIEFRMLVTKEMNDRKKDETLKIQRNKIILTRHHHFESERVGDAIMLSQLVSSIASGGLLIDIGATVKWIHQKIEKYKKRSYVPLWLRKMQASKGYRFYGKSK